MAEALAGGAKVISLGGGTPTAPGVCDDLAAAKRERGVVVVYLWATPAVLRARLAATGVDSRPSLTGAGTLDEIEAVFSKRDGLYRENADFTVDVGALSEEEALTELRRISATASPP